MCDYIQDKIKLCKADPLGARMYSGQLCSHAQAPLIKSQSQIPSTQKPFEGTTMQEINPSQSKIAIAAIIYLHSPCSICNAYVSL